MCDSDNDDFEEQLLKEAEEARRLKGGDDDSGVKTRTDEDGTVFEWDEGKRAWFPRFNEDILAEYQMKYGVTETANQKTVASDSASQSQPAGESAEYGQQWSEYYDSLPEEEREKAKEQWAEYYNSEEYRAWYAEYNKQMKTAEEPAVTLPQQPVAKKVKHQPEWFDIDETKNTHVYVQNLPKDITEEEFIETMSKVGMILHDPLTRKPKIKLYRDEQGVPTGDGRCGYIRIESVDLALQILDGYNLRGNILVVEKAKFQLKGQFDPTKRRKLTNKEKKKAKEHQEKLFAWQPEQSRFVRPKRERIVVIKNVFDPSEFEQDPLLIPKVKDQLSEECKTFGTVYKTQVHDRHAEGVCVVNFSDPTEADLAVSQLGGRFFRGRVVTAELWDGKTKFHVQETEEEKERRLQAWEQHLVGGSSSEQVTSGINIADGDVDSPRTPDDPRGLTPTPDDTTPPISENECESEEEPD